MKEKIKELFWEFLLVLFLGSVILSLIKFLNTHDFFVKGDFVVIFLIIHFLRTVLKLKK